MKKRLRIRCRSHPAITITRQALKADKLVYVARTNKPLRYRHGRSCIAYIGTTQAGAARVAQSAASRAPQLLKIYGVKSIEFYVVTCAPRAGLRAWRKLERALLLVFRERYGEKPWCNKQGTHIKWQDELKYFSRKALEEVLAKHS